MMAMMSRLTLMSLIVGNSFKFTTLVRISADTIRMVYEMRPCADILSGDPPRMASGWHPVNTELPIPVGGCSGSMRRGQVCCNDVCALGLLGALFMGLIYENSGPAS
jgi:hypothetical protein